MNELTVKVGDKIRYTSAAGTRIARVMNIQIAPTARPNHSIVWLGIRVFGGKFPSDIQIPADAGSLKAFKVELV